MLQDNRFRWLRLLSLQESAADNAEMVGTYLAYPCGLIKGACPSGLRTALGALTHPHTWRLTGGALEVGWTAHIGRLPFLQRGLQPNPPPTRHWPEA